MDHFREYLDCKYIYDFSVFECKAKLNSLQQIYSLFSFIFVLVPFQVAFFSVLSSSLGSKKHLRLIKDCDF